MVKREQYTISFTKEEALKVRESAIKNGETFSGHIRRKILLIVGDETNE